jgi:hypothetical protein
MADAFLVHHADGICRPLLFSGGGDGGGAGGEGTPIVITASVGINGANRPVDVPVIQRALNDVPADQGRPAPLLEVDGICGPKTKNAIQAFQLKHFGWKGADGRVDPDKQTIAKLNELAGDAAAARARLKGGRIARISGLLSHALRCINVAQKNLEFAQTFLDRTDSPDRAAALLMVNRHFDLDTYSSARRHQVLGQLLHTFRLMLQVFQRPGGLWGTAIFDLDPTGATEGVAYTFEQGFQRPGRTRMLKGKRIRTDAVYFCDGIDTMHDEESTIVIVHELAHFVGSPVPIIDFAYGWFDTPKMRRLVPSQKLLNAMSHNNFAWDVLHHRKPIGL